MTSVAPETPRAHAHRSLAYRPAIDGLRAFAVVSVILYHGMEAVMPGGWFGVDVFFVISGFLITSLLLSEHRRWGSIDLWGFWRARMRRLLPALFLVLAAVVALAPFLVPSGRRASVGWDALAALFYVANWRFLLGDEAYFTQLSAPSPLRHTWSLGVEEQYYILFPLLLASILAWSRRRAKVALVLGAIAALSALLMASLADPGGTLERVYYGTDTRAHQLLIGAVVATLLSPGRDGLRRSVRDRIDRVVRVASLPAFVLLLSAFWWATAAQDALMNGLLTPMSIAVAVVVAAAASRQTSLVQRLLSWEPLRLVGLISYGLYLWHWPIMVFLTPQRTGLGEVLVLALQIALTFALAYLSFRFVEQPVRRHGVRHLVPRVPRLGLAVAWCSAPLLVAGALSIPAAGRALNPVSAAPGGDIVVRPPAYEVSTRVSKHMLVGNSVPASLLEGYQSHQYPDTEVVTNTNIGCDPVRAQKVIGTDVVEISKECSEWIDGWAASVAREEPDVVALFISQALVTDRVDDGRRLVFGTEEYATFLYGQLDEAEKALTRGGRSRLTIVNVACHEMPGLTDEITRINDDRYVMRLNEIVDEWAQQHDVPVIDQYGLLCTQGYHPTINQTELYGDGIHFTKESGAIMWTWLMPQLQAVAEGRDPAEAVAS